MDYWQIAADVLEAAILRNTHPRTWMLKSITCCFPPQTGRGATDFQYYVMVMCLSNILWYALRKDEVIQISGACKRISIHTYLKYSISLTPGRLSVSVPLRLGEAAMIAGHLLQSVSSRAWAIEDRFVQSRVAYGEAVTCPSFHSVVLAKRMAEGVLSHNLNLVNTLSLHLPVILLTPTIKCAKKIGCEKRPPRSWQLWTAAVEIVSTC